MRFWITSMGRTATKWLAAQLRVPHEPRELPPKGMVSPKHLGDFVILGWRPPPKTEIAIVVRNAEDQMRSAINKWRYDHPNPALRTKIWMGRVPVYLGVFQGWVYQGAKVIDYSRMVSDEGYLQRIADHFGCERDASKLSKIMNKTPRELPVELSAKQKKLARDIQELYDKWLDQSGM